MQQKKPSQTERLSFIELCFRLFCNNFERQLELNFFVKFDFGNILAKFFNVVAFNENALAVNFNALLLDGFGKLDVVDRAEDFTI